MEFFKHSIVFLGFIRSLYAADYCFVDYDYEYCEHGCCEEDDVTKCCEDYWYIPLIVCIIVAVVIFVAIAFFCWYHHAQKRKTRTVGTVHISNTHYNNAEAGHHGPFVIQPQPPPYYEHSQPNTGAPGQAQLYNHNAQALDPTCPPGALPNQPPPPAVYYPPTKRY